MINRPALIFFVFLTLVSCISAPEFERNNPRDLSAGIPYVRDFRYVIDNRGLIANWVDGSIENDIFIITQKMYDHSNSDSLIKITFLEGDQIYYWDKSGQYGYPYSLVINSIIYKNSDSIKAQFSDTLDIEFGELIYRSQYEDSDSLVLNWQTLPNPFINVGILVELDNGNGWEQVDLLPYNYQLFKYSLQELTTNSRFRISIAIRNYNGTLSRASGFEVSPE